MTNAEYIRLKAQAAVLREVALEYAGHTIENIINQIDSRIKHQEQHEVQRHF